MYHPDRAEMNHLSSQEAEEYFKNITEAFESIRDGKPYKSKDRARTDRSGIHDPERAKEIAREFYATREELSRGLFRAEFEKVEPKLMKKIRFYADQYIRNFKRDFVGAGDQKEWPKVRKWFVSRAEQVAANYLKYQSQNTGPEDSLNKLSGLVSILLVEKALHGTQYESGRPLEEIEGELFDAQLLAIALVPQMALSFDNDLADAVIEKEVSRKNALYGIAFYGSGMIAAMVLSFFDDYSTLGAVIGTTSIAGGAVVGLEVIARELGLFARSLNRIMPWRPLIEKRERMKLHLKVADMKFGDDVHAGVEGRFKVLRDSASEDWELVAASLSHFRGFNFDSLFPWGPMGLSGVLGSRGFELLRSAYCKKAFE